MDRISSSALSNIDWQDEPTEPGWWWCYQNDKSDHLHTRLVIVLVHSDENGLYVTGSLSRADCVGFTGEYSGDVCGKWLGPIQKPDLPSDV